MMPLLDTFAEPVQSIAIGGHVRPDGDCAGSCLGVYNYLKNLYPEKEIDLYLEPIPDKFSFLKRSEEIIHPANGKKTEPYDLFIALDCGDLSRLNKSGKYFKNAKQTLCVDHHLSNQGFADRDFIFPEASSTSELVYQMMNPSYMSKDIAECLYLGLVHDTGVFQYSCTSSRTMEIAGALMDHGINYPKIVDETFFVKTYKQRRIAGKAMQKSKLCLDGKCIYSVLKKKHLLKYEATGADLEGIVSELRSTEGVEVSLFLYEMDDHRFKISMRSASYVDVSAIMSHFGGGGHARAAGGTSGGPADDIINRILEMVKQQLADHEEVTCTMA